MALKEMATEMYDQVSSVVDVMDLLYVGLINNNIKVIDRAEELLEPISARSEALTDELVKESKTDAVLAPYVSVPSHIGRVGSQMKRVADALRKKIDSSVLFSDRAVSELEYLFERDRDILVHTRDMILARNTLVARHLEESQKAVERTADDYATRHEERLIEGLCAPKASELFLQMLESFKVIAWHAKEIAKDLS